MDFLSLNKKELNKQILVKQDRNKRNLKTLTCVLILLSAPCGRTFVMSDVSIGILQIAPLSFGN